MLSPVANMKHALALLLALAIPSFAAAQSPGDEPPNFDEGFYAYTFGSGCSATLIPQTFVWNDGRDETFEVLFLDPSTTACVLALDLNETLLSLDPIDMLGCTLYLDDIRASFPMIVNGTSASVSLPFGPDIDLVTIYWQAFALSPAANPLGVVSSNQLRWIPAIDVD